MLEGVVGPSSPNVGKADPPDELLFKVKVQVLSCFKYKDKTLQKLTCE